jgi:hypothetical protein
VRGWRFASCTCAAVGVAVEAFAVDAHRGGGDDAADRLVDQFFEQNGGADIVDRGVALHCVHRLADPDFGGEVDHAAHALERLGDGVAVADVGADQLDIVGKILGPFAVPVDLLDQAVEDAHLMAAALKFPSDGTSDEAGAAGDENPFGQVNPRLIYVKRNEFGSLAASSSTHVNTRSASLFQQRKEPPGRSPRQVKQRQQHGTSPPPGRLGGR